MYSPWLWSDSIFRFSSYFKKQNEALLSIHGFTLRVINDRKRERNGKRVNTFDKTQISLKKNNAFLDLLIDISELFGGNLSDADLREEVDTFMFEGLDTTATALSWAIYLIGSHSHIQDRVADELYSVFGSSQRNPTMNDIRKLKYLEMVVKECLRLYPPVLTISRNLTQDVVLSGYQIPASTIVEIQIYRIHRNPKYFNNPDQFNPENFSIEKSSKRHPFAFIPFSAGPRNCIGQKLAFLEEKVVLSSLLRKYKVESLQKPEDIYGVPDIVLRPGDGIKVKITKRESKMKL